MTPPGDSTVFETQDEAPSGGIKGQAEAAKSLTISSEHRLRSENLPFDIDVWYPSLHHFTFPTEFVPLSRPEGRAIVRYYHTRYNHRCMLTGPDVRVLQGLEARLDKVLKTRFKETGAFIRLCGRSPKDADPLHRHHILSAYRTSLARLIQEGAPATPNTKLRSMAEVPVLRVSCGAEAMSLLLSSERVFTDCHDWIKYGEPEQVVFRRWDSRLSLDLEFRGFVCRGQLRALSQYDHYMAFPHLAPLKDKIQACLVDMWAKVHPYVGVDSYVIDMAYFPHTHEAIVIEISPFLRCTGPALFHWVHDKQVMENGPLEFRLNIDDKDGVKEGLADLVELWELRWMEKGVPCYSDLYDEILLAERQQRLMRPSMRLTAGAVGVCGGALVTYWLRKVLSREKEEGLVFFPLATTLGTLAVGSLSSIALYPLARWALTCLNLDSLKEKWRSLRRTRLFVYGTLKKGFHWHHKFLSQSTFVGHAMTLEPYPLVVGESGVPYLLGDLPGSGKCVRGEVWEVDHETLVGLDEYEGVTKGYYDRRGIKVTLQARHEKQAPPVIQAQVYFKTLSSEALRCLPFLEEYTLEYHHQHYKAIRHIQVKQQKYLGCDSIYMDADIYNKT